MGGWSTIMTANNCVENSENCPLHRRIPMDKKQTCIIDVDQIMFHRQVFKGSYRLKRVGCAVGTFRFQLLLKKVPIGAQASYDFLKYCE